MLVLLLCVVPPGGLCSLKVVPESLSFNWLVCMSVCSVIHESASSSQAKFVETLVCYMRKNSVDDVLTHLFCNLSLEVDDVQAW